MDHRPGEESVKDTSTATATRSETTHVVLPSDLCAQLERVASARGVSADVVAASALRGALPALLASMEKDGEVALGNMKAAPSRRTTELRALRCRLMQQIAGYPYGPSGDAALVDAIGKDLPEDRFLLLRHIAARVDRGEIRDTETIPAEVAELQREENEGASAVPLEDVHRWMHDDAVHLVAAFRVHGRVPLAATTDFDEVDSCRIRLVAGKNPFVEAWTTEVVEVVIEVPIPDAHDIESVFGGGGGDVEYEIDSDGLRSRPMERARRVLEHVLVVLRLHGAALAYDDHRGEHGVPFRVRVQRRFPDGCVVDRPARSIHYGTRGTWSPSPAIAAKPLRVPQDLFARAFDAASTEVALLAGSAFLESVDLARRCLLVVESVFAGVGATFTQADASDESRPTIVQGMTTPAAARIIEPVLRAHATELGALAHLGRFAAEAAAVRNMLSHLKRDEIGAGDVLLRSSSGFGIDIYDLEDRHRVHRILPTLVDLATKLVDLKVPSLQIFAFRDRPTSLDEMADLLASDAYLLSNVARDFLLNASFLRIASGEQADGLETPLCDALQARRFDLPLLARAAARLSAATRRAALAALGPDDDLSRRILTELVANQADWPQNGEDILERVLELSEAWLTAHYERVLA